MARRGLSGLFAQLVFAAVAEAFVIILLFRDHLPKNPLLWTLLRCIIFNHVAFITWAMGIQPYFLSPLRHLPHPKGGYLFLGHGLSLFKKPPGEDFLQWMIDIPNDGLLMFRGFGHQPRLILTNPKALGEVLVQKPYDYKKPAPLRAFLRRILGNGLIIVEGEEHKFQRKHIMPVFSFRHIKDLYPMMWKKGVALTQGVEAEIKEQFQDNEKRPSGVTDVNHWANRVTMDIIGVAGLGRDFNALKNSDDPLIQNYEELLEPTKEKLTYFATQIVLPQGIVNRLPWKLNDRMRAITANLKVICAKLVREKRELLKSSSDDKDDHIDILSVLLRSNNFSDPQLVDQLLTFLAAGHETTSSAFTWVTYLLATHPDVQTRLREEVQANMPDSLPEVDIANVLESLPLLNAVCNETIRLYPTVPLTIRDAIRDTSILGQFVPRGTSVHLVPWATNRNPQFWGEDAAEFRPERWIDPETGKPNKTGGSSSNYNILTFLHGPRSCIGKDFAIAEMRCLVAAFVAAFEMELADPNEVCAPYGVVTTKPKNGMNLRLTPVKT